LIEPNEIAVFVAPRAATARHAPRSCRNRRCRACSHRTRDHGHPSVKRRLPDLLGRYRSATLHASHVRQARAVRALVLRVKPTVGLTYTPPPSLTLFAAYGEASRAPSAVELSCADPDEPCRLPNAFVVDPPLEQVVRRSVEFGARGAFGPTRRPAFSWSLAGSA